MHHKTFEKKNETGNEGEREGGTGSDLKEDVDDEDVEDVLEGDDDAVEDGFELWDSVDGLQWT